MSASFIFMFSSRGFAQEQRPSHFFFVSGVSREQIRVILIHLLYFCHTDLLSANALRPFSFFVSGVSREQIRVMLIHLLWESLKIS